MNVRKGSKLLVNKSTLVDGEVLPQADDATPALGRAARSPARQNHPRARHLTQAAREQQKGRDFGYVDYPEIVDAMVNRFVNAGAHSGFSGAVRSILQFLEVA